MWRQIRGLGLAYNFMIFIDPDSGLMYFILSNATHLVKGYKEAYTIVVSVNFFNQNLIILIFG